MISERNLEVFAKGRAHEESKTNKEIEELRKERDNENESEKKDDKRLLKEKKI